MSDIFSGLVVLELASILAGPAVGAFFAELGATVVKVENPLTGGDATRSWTLAGESVQDGISSYFASANWGKLSLAADLSVPGGRAAVGRLAEKADVVISNFRPTVARKLGMDYATLSTRNPGLVYGWITGFGRQDPRPGYDALLQAETGFLSMNGNPGEPPAKLPVALIDVLAGHHLKEGLTLALMRRERSGRGCLVEVSLFDAALASLVNQATNWLMGGWNPRPMGTEHPNLAPYGTLLPCQNGEDVLLAVGSDKQFAGLCHALGIPNLAQDSRFARNPQRVVNRRSMNRYLAEASAALVRSELLDRLEKWNVPAGAVRDVAQTLELDAARPMVLRELTPTGTPVAGVRGNAFKMDGQAALPVAPPPAVGEHTCWVLGALAGYKPEEVQTFLDEQAVVQAP